MSVCVWHHYRMNHGWTTKNSLFFIENRYFERKKWFINEFIWLDYEWINTPDALNATRVQLTWSYNYYVVNHFWGVPLRIITHEITLFTHKWIDCFSSFHALAFRQCVRKGHELIHAHDIYSLIILENDSFSCFYRKNGWIDSSLCFIRCFII